MDKKQSRDTVEHAALAGAQADRVRRYGTAVKEHFAAYTGTDYEHTTAMAKGLKEIAQSRIDPNNPQRSIKQQAGFAAEVKAQARENAEKAIKGDICSRVVRTDDMARQLDGKGHCIGGKNEPLYDLAQVDANGRYVKGTGVQLKFVGKTPKECCQKLLAGRCDKYREAGVPIEVPADFYDGVQQELSACAETLNRQIQSAETRGNQPLAEKHKQRLRVVEDTKKNLRKSTVSSTEAVESRVHPVLSTAKDMTRLSHRAGVEAGKSGAVVGGGLSLVRNSAAVIRGEKPVCTAVAEVIGDTAKASGISYATAYAGAILKGALQNAPSSYIRTLSGTNLPAAVVVSSLEMGKTLARCGRGELAGTECLAELGEKGSGMLAASAGAAVGQMLIPIPLVGGLVGSMAGCAMAGTSYRGFVSALQEAELAREEHSRIQAECAASIPVIQNYGKQLQGTLQHSLMADADVFRRALAGMGETCRAGDADIFISDSGSVIRWLGGTPMFDTKSQFDALMKSNTMFEI